MVRLFSFLTMTSVLSYSLVSSAQTNPQPEDVCRIDFSGSFTSVPDAYGTTHKFAIQQDHCVLTVTESWKDNTMAQTPQKNLWTIDLSGKTESTVPSSIIAANSSSQLGKQSLESLRATVKSAGLDPVNGLPILAVKIKIHLPAVETNRIDADLVVDATIMVDSFGTPNGQQAQYFFTQIKKVRVESVNSPKLIGPVKAAFIAGANYVLRFLDKANVIGLVTPQASTIARENKN